MYWSLDTPKVVQGLPLEHLDHTGCSNGLEVETRMVFWGSLIKTADDYLSLILVAPVPIFPTLLSAH